MPRKAPNILLAQKKPFKAQIFDTNFRPSYLLIFNTNLSFYCSIYQQW